MTCVANPASLDLLAYLVRLNSAGNLMFILACWRDEDLNADTFMASAGGSAARKYATNLHLNCLQPAAGRSGAMYPQVKGWLPDGFTDRLYRCEGLPTSGWNIWTHYSSTRWRSSTELDPEMAIQDWELPDRVRDLLRLRVAQVDELARQLLAAAAVIGRSFDFETLVAASGRSESEAMTGLETLLAHRLVEECGDCDSAGSLRYDFTHDKLRSLVYGEISFTRRRLLHQRIAEALSASARSREPGLVAGPIAYHIAWPPYRVAVEYHRGWRSCPALYTPTGRLSIIISRHWKQECTDLVP
jgi:hypothetical protein